MNVNAFRIALFGSLATAACAWAPSALADNLGSPVDVGGGQQWTVGNLQPSTDAIPYQPAGSLWEATATSQLAGGGIPVIPGFAANSGAQTYPVLWGVASAQGINPASLPAGGSTTGKIYFDVTGGAPNSVSYAVDGQQVANWVQPPPPVVGTAPAYTAPRAAAPMPAAVAPAATAPAAVNPAPAAAGSSGTPAPAAAGSSGTPLPASGSAGTPLPAEGSTAPSAAAATPSTAAAPASTPSTSAAPAPASASAAPSPASTATAAPATPTTTSTAPN